ncbi:MAG TPA: DUF3072 domain-containing protein [Puia sp.]|nr:DUF3072 domain-containing protein [Puia sp.]
MKKENEQTQKQESGNQQSQAGSPDNTIKNPDDWKTGDEPMTGAQNSYLHTLASQVHENVDDDMTKADASKKIDELRQKAGLEND